MNEQSSQPEHAASIRFVADYQLFGDVEGRAWMVETLDRARQAGQIAAFEVTGSHPGPYGIQLVTFTVDVPLAEDSKWPPSLGYDEAKERAEGLLSEIVGDSDIEVRWASPLQGQPQVAVDRDADRDALDAVASVLADPEWSSEHLEWVADAVAQARPHPGGYETRAEYAAVFATETGRVLPGDNDDDDDDHDFHDESYNRALEEERLGRPLFPNEY